MAPTLLLDALSFDAIDPLRLARFWAYALRWEVGEPSSYGMVSLLPTDGTRFSLRFLPTSEPKRGRNRIHLDLTTSSLADQQETAELLLEHGGRHIDVGQGPDDGQIVLADPEGNELCIIEPDNGFLADCPRLGAINCDGTQAVGYFWGEALGWPLVWDQDEETAIRASDGTGPIIAWGGPPVLPKDGKARLHLDLVPAAGSDQQTEVERLISLGATRVDIGQGDVDWVVLADPDGNELCVLAPAELTRSG